MKNNINSNTSKALNMLNKLSNKMSVYVITKGDICVGRIVTTYTPNPNGRICHTAMTVYHSDKEPIALYAQCGGYGYDKFGANMETIINNNKDLLHSYGLSVYTVDDYCNDWQWIFYHAEMSIHQVL